MAKAGITVVGGRQLRSTMRRAGEDLADLKAAHAAVAAQVAQAAAARAPRRTGRLASTVRGNKAVARSVVMAGSAAVRYAPPVHWGWAARGIEANPWISDTATDTESQWLGIFEQAMASAIDRIEGA